MLTGYRATNIGNLLALVASLKLLFLVGGPLTTYPFAIGGTFVI
jgi:hypothetical protein